jgi:hypothetical protein
LNIKSLFKFLGSFSNMNDENKPDAEKATKGSRGGLRPGSGRKRENPIPPIKTKAGRGGARPGAGRKPKSVSTGHPQLIALVCERSGETFIDRLFASARAGNISALRRLVGIFEAAEKTLGTGDALKTSTDLFDQL